MIWHAVMRAQSSTPSLAITSTVTALLILGGLVYVVKTELRIPFDGF